MSAMKYLFFKKSQCKLQSCDSHCTLCCLGPVKTDIKKKKITLELFLKCLGLFSHNKFSINHNVEAFLSCFQWWLIKFFLKRENNYHDTDTALYVLKNPVVLTETLARVCKSVLMSALPVPMDWPKRLALPMRKMKKRWSEYDFSWWVKEQTRI